MNIKELILEALSDGTAELDKNGNASFELFGKAYSVRVTDDELAKYEAKITASVERAEQDIVDAESAIVTSKALIEKHNKKKRVKK